MTAEATDQQLVARAQKGDTRAFDVLVLKYQHRIFGLIGRYISDSDEVQDVAPGGVYKSLPGAAAVSRRQRLLYLVVSHCD